MANVIIKGKHPNPEYKARNKTCFFPRKSWHGYYDKTFQRRFYSKQEKLDFMNKHGWIESHVPSKEHLGRVNDFVEHCKNEKRKNPEFKYKGAYPD